MAILWVIATVAILLVTAAILAELLNLGNLHRDEPELDEHQAEQNTRPHAHIKVIRK
jgi:hypothetical protein